DRVDWRPVSLARVVVPDAATDRRQNQLSRKHDWYTALYAAVRRRRQRPRDQSNIREFRVDRRRRPLPSRLSWLARQCAAGTRSLPPCRLPGRLRHRPLATTASAAAAVPRHAAVLDQPFDTRLRLDRDSRAKRVAEPISDCTGVACRSV